MMRILNKPFLITSLLIVWICLHQSCTHDPTFLEMDPMDDPVDTMDVDTMTLDTMMMDTTQMGEPCEPGVAYFEKDILPIFVANCAFSGCHDASTATRGVILDSYENITSTTNVVPFDLEETQIFRVITSDNPSELMPPSGSLNSMEIHFIEEWILQGAENLDCDEDLDNCETENVSFSGFIVEVFQNSCNGCHSTGVASGGVITDTYEGVRSTVDAGRLFGALNRDEGFSEMPQGQDKLDDCTLDKIKSWIDAGAENN